MEGRERAQKKPTSNFFNYASKRRQQIEKGKPELDNLEIFRIIEGEWNVLSDEQKKKYEKSVKDIQKNEVEI